MQPIEVRNQDRDRQDEHQEVPNEQVRAPQAQLDDLHHELSRRLRDGVVAQPTSVPATSPPCSVRLVVLELTSEEDGDEEFVDGTLDKDGGDETEDCVRGVPGFEEPLSKTCQHLITNVRGKETHQELKERNDTNGSQDVSKSSHERTELGISRVEHRSQHQRNEEQHDEHRRVPHHRSK